MDNFKNICKFSEKYFEENNITINDKEKKNLVIQFSLHIEYIMFNLLSMMCLIAIINTSDKITDKTILVGKKYIEENCGFSYSGGFDQSGGSRLGSATFLGVSEPMYNAGNSTNDLLTIDFENGVDARPQIGGKTMKYNKMLKSLVSKYVNDIIKYHGLKASKEIKKELHKLIVFHIDCLKDALQSKKNVTTDIMKKLIKKHKVLKPLM